MEKLIRNFTVVGESIMALRASMPKLIQAIEVSCRYHQEIVENTAAMPAEGYNFRLIHYFTFTPWEVYQEFIQLKSELDGQKLNDNHMLDFYRFEGIKTEDEIEQIKRRMTDEWIANPLQQELSEKRIDFLSVRQTIELRAEKIFNSDLIEVSIFDCTGLMDAAGHESGKKVGSLALINAPLRDGVKVAIGTIMEQMLPSTKAKDEWDGHLSMEQAMKLAKDSNSMRAWAKNGYSINTAKKIISVFTDEYYARVSSYEQKWGVTNIYECMKDKYEANTPASETISRYLATFYRAGWRKIDGIEIPYSPRK